MNKDIKPIEIEGDKIYLKKGFDGWRIVYPLKDEDGKKIWKNIIWGGSYWKFIKIFFLVLLVLGVGYAYYQIGYYQGEQSVKPFLMGINNYYKYVDHNLALAWNESMINITNITLFPPR